MRNALILHRQRGHIFLVLAALISLLSGCQDPQRAPLVGTWTLASPERMAKRIDQDAAAVASVDDRTDSSADSVSASKMVLSFSGNGQFQTQTAMGSVNRQKNGTWSVISFDETARKMTISCTVGLQVTEHAVELIDDDSIRLVPPNLAGLSTKLRFERQSAR